jgi:hypothetical protein
MPEDAAKAYAVWDSVAAGNVSETARLLGMRRPTVQDWSQRYRWRERQANQRAEDRDRTISLAYGRMVEQMSTAVDTIVAAVSTRLDENGKPPPGSPTIIAVRSAFHILAVFGIAPVRNTNVRLTTSPKLQSSYTDDELDAMSLDELIALSQGRPLPKLPPQDFTSTQPGGREVTDPPIADTEDAVSQALGVGPTDAAYSVGDAVESPRVSGDGFE